MPKKTSVRACAVLFAALLLAACGASRKSAGTHSTGTPAASSSAPAAPTSTGTVGTSTSPAPASGPGRCRASGLALAFLGQQGATGHGELGFELRNVGSTTCRTSGYPGVLFLDRNGKPLPTVPTHTTRDYFGSAPLVSLLLAPGQHASFRLGVTHGINSTVGCTTAYALQVIAPNDTATLRTSIPDGAYECRTATVSPLRPGVSAFP